MRNSSTRSLTICAVGSALSFVLLWFGTAMAVLDMSATVLCGAVTMLLAREAGTRRAACAVAVCFVLSAVLLPDKTVCVLYLAVGGAYPLLRPTAERLGKIRGVTVKVAAALASILLYCASLYIFIPSETGKFLLPIAIMLGGACFFLYDVLLGRFLVMIERRFGSKKS